MLETYQKCDLYSKINVQRHYCSEYMGELTPLKT
jgi:hypothetical protein